MTIELKSRPASWYPADIEGRLHTYLHQNKLQILSQKLVGYDHLTVSDLHSGKPSLDLLL